MATEGLRIKIAKLRGELETRGYLTCCPVTEGASVLEHHYVYERLLGEFNRRVGYHYCPICGDRLWKAVEIEQKGHSECLDPESKKHQMYQKWKQLETQVPPFEPEAKKVWEEIILPIATLMGQKIITGLDFHGLDERLRREEILYHDPLNKIFSSATPNPTQQLLPFVLTLLHHATQNHTQ